jgi:hypothetical protein
MGRYYLWTDSGESVSLRG